MTDSSEPVLDPEIQEKHGLDTDRNAKDIEVSGETEVYIETEIKVEFDLETVAHWVMFRDSNK